MLFPRAALIFLLLVGSTACAKLHARTAPESPLPPLETPTPPPRVIVPIIESEPIVNTAVPAVEAPDRRLVREPARPAQPSKTEKPEPPPAASTNPPAASANPTADNAGPPLALQTTADAAAMEQKVRALLASAARDLGRVDHRTLSVDAKAQYDIAKRFSEQAEEALKAKNLVFAGQLADKAAVLAALLLKR